VRVDRERNTAEHNFSAIPSKSNPRDAPVLEAVGNPERLSIENKHDNEIPSDSVELVRHFPGHVCGSLRFGERRRSLHISLLGRITATVRQSRDIRLQILCIRDIRVHSTHRTLFYKHDVHTLCGCFKAQARDYRTNDSRSYCRQR